MEVRESSERIYDRGDGRVKHCWNKDYAGFVPGARGQIGKCSNKITDAIATNLLRSGVYDNRELKEMDGYRYPEEIYTVFEGAVYVAVPTRPGISYHGYPFKGSLTKRIVAKLKDIAKDADCDRQFEKWVKEYIV